MQTIPKGRSLTQNTTYAFGAWFGGAVGDILERCDRSVMQRRAMLGWLVLAVISFSSVVTGVACATIFNSIWVGFGAGIIWAFLMIPLDRAILSTMNGAGAIKRSLLMLALRIVIVALVSSFNAETFQLIVFQTEIEAKIEQNKLTELQQLDSDVATARENYNAWRNGERARIDNARNTLVGEISGTSGTRRPGFGEIAQARREQLDQEEASFAEATQNGPQAQTLRDAEKARDDARSAIEGKTSFGLIDRQRALNQVAAEEPFFVWVLRGLFFTVELLAFLVKLMMRTDEYDRRIDSEDEESALRIEADAEELRRKRREGRIADIEHEAEAAEAFASASAQIVTAQQEIIRNELALTRTYTDHALAVEEQVRSMKSAGVRPKVREGIAAKAHGNVISLFDREQKVA